MAIHFSMSHSSGRVLSGKQNVFPVFNKQLKTTGKNCSPVNISTTNYTCSNHDNNTDGQHSHKHKMKRFKTRKERSQVRSSGEGASKSKSHCRHHHHHHHHQSSKDKACFHYCQSSSHCPPRRDALFARSFPAAQEPSIITDSRLIGHHGLFNHEVKSIDIERLLSEQRKLEKLEQHRVRENDMAALHPFPRSYLPSPCSSSDLVVAKTNEGPLIDKKADPVTEAHQVCQEKKKTTCQSNSQGSDITPGQRPQHQLDLSSESDNGVFSSTNSTPYVLTTKSMRAKSVVSEKDRGIQLTTSGEKENVRPLKKKVKGQLNFHTLEDLPKNQEPQHQRTQTCGPSPKPLQLSSSPIAGTSDSFDTQAQGGGLDCMSSVAARLCHCLQLPLMRRRNLVAESREVLLQALRERHGPLLQENLLKAQRHLTFDTGHMRAAQSLDKGPSLIDTDGIWPTGSFNTDTGQTCYDTQKTASFKRRKRQRSNWMSPPQPRRSLDQAGWMTSPSVEKVGDLLDEMLRPSSSSQFCTDFEPSGASSPSHFFAPSLMSRWEVQASPFQPWDDIFNRATSKESVRLDCFENRFLDQTKAVAEGSSGLQYCESSRQSLLTYLARLPNGHPADPRQFPQAQDPFEIDRGPFAPSSSQVHYPQESNQLYPSYHFSHPPNGSSLRSHHTNMMHYPPSHMLERSPLPPLPSFPSPEQWSFPPMRLY